MFSSTVHIKSWDLITYPYSNVLQWRHKNVMASRLFAQPFVQAQIKENIKAPRCLCEGNPPVTDGFPTQRASKMFSFGDVIMFDGGLAKPSLNLGHGWVIASKEINGSNYPSEIIVEMTLVTSTWVGELRQHWL